MYRALLLAIVLAANTQTQNPTEADWAWLEEHAHEAFDAFVPMTGDRQVVAYRSYRDLYRDVHETLLAIRQLEGTATRTVRMAATLVTPIERSIQEQLLALHMANRQATLVSLLPAVKVHRLDVTPEQCPAIKQRVDALAKVSLTLPDWNLIVLHPMFHRIVFSMGIERVDATVIDEDSPVVRWATDTMKVIRSCAAARK